MAAAIKVCTSCYRAIMDPITYVSAVIGVSNNGNKPITAINQ